MGAYASYRERGAPRLRREMKRDEEARIWKSRRILAQRVVKKNFFFRYNFYISGEGQRVGASRFAREISILCPVVRYIDRCSRDIRIGNYSARRYSFANRGTCRDRGFPTADRETPPRDSVRFRRAYSPGKLL